MSPSAERRDVAARAWRERAAEIVAADRQPFRGGGAWLLAGLVAGIAGAIGLAIGLAIDVRQVLFSYLIAYTFALTIVLGMAAFLMACHTMAATWPVALRRLAEATTATMPLLALFFVPVLLGLSQLYPVDAPERGPGRPRRGARAPQAAAHEPPVRHRARGLLRRGVGRDLRRPARASRWRWIAPARRT